MTDTTNNPDQAVLPLVDDNPAPPAPPAMSLEPIIDGIPLTDWFEPSVNPSHVGVYKTQTRTPAAHGDDDIQNGFSYWNGTAWGPQFDTAREAEASGDSASFPSDNYHWRGLTAEHEEHQL